MAMYSRLGKNFITQRGIYPGGFTPGDLSEKRFSKRGSYVKGGYPWLRACYPRPENGLNHEFSPKP
jgi:hypothetical protein